MIEIKVPDLAESITEGTISQWLLKVGDKVNKGESIVELETDKVNIEVNTDFSGTLTKMLKVPGDVVQVGEVIAILDENVSSSSPTESSATLLHSAEASATLGVSPSTDKIKRPIASPAARKLARKLGVNLNDIQSIDPLGRIRPNDVQVHHLASHSATVLPTQPVSISTSESDKPVEKQKMSRRRQVIAKRLVEVQHTAAMLTTFNEVDMSAIMNIRKRRKESFFDQYGVRLGYMSFFTKAVVAALKKFPLLNAEIQDDELLVKKHYDIGIAVAAPEGLVVPVVQDANKKSFAEIEQIIIDLGKKARDNKLTLKELQGGTFTITNGGVFGSLMSTPILNAPQVGILGMHTIQLRPVAIDAERMENRPMMYIALSYDHRIVDGKEAVSFLATVKRLLEDPESLLLEG